MKRMEIEAMCGYIVKKGVALDIPTPTIDTVYSLLKFNDEKPNIS